MTTPPRQPTREMTNKNDSAPSAEQDQNGGQGHAASVHCSLRALPLESGNAREATCLNTEPSARIGADTQQGQLGANAGSIPAPPTTTPAAHPAEPSATDDLVRRLRMLRAKRGDKAWGEAANAIERQAREIATAKADRNTYDAAHKRQAVATLEQSARAERAEAEIESLRAECGLRQIQGYKEGKEAASARLYEAEAEQLTRDMRQRAERAERDLDKLRSDANESNRILGERCEKLEAERDALRECVKAADAMRRGEDCPMCDSGELRNPAKLHWDSCAFANYDAARAKAGT